MREVVARVVDHFVGALSAHEVRVGRAAHADHVRAEMLRDLHGKVADAAGRAGDEHALPGGQSPMFRERLPCGPACHRQRSGIREVDAVRDRHEIHGGDHDEFREGAVAHHGRERTKYALAHVSWGRAAADGDDFARDIAAGPARRPAKNRHPAQVPRARLAVEWIEARRANAQLHFTRTGRRLRDVGDVQYVGRAIPVIADGAHQCINACRARARAVRPAGSPPASLRASPRAPRAPRSPLRKPRATSPRTRTSGRRA